MPQLPEDIIDRLTQMERRIQQLSTAVNTRPALNTVSGGTLEVGPATGSRSSRSASGPAPASTAWNSAARPVPAP